MAQVWFVPFGWVHRPVTLAGWLITLAAVAYMLQLFLAMAAHAHSITDMLYAIYLHWGVTFLGWEWVARRAGRGTSGQA
ncbi:hypothetical protein GCM10008098_26920 [Rhodanobacter panaciterrae]|uniref:Uncharacterized protein n=1 Tax=Rhodanobacter panaciterrae TaxID=490572 RepID=A0ABQ3A3Q5_9GAMM|nr:hypothetical protein [Rhodanobacter panaciterrae]GGY32127.1 hypothetical protein GCM10008098_26920 [Rhodanobacter panaciterrae]